MAQGTYSIDLNGAAFPMLSEQQSRTVIGTNAADAEGAKVGVAYCHNVMPSLYGLDSVGYLESIPKIADLPSGAEVRDVRIIYGSLKTRLHLTWDTLGNLYILKPNSSAWQKITVSLLPESIISIGSLAPSNISIGTVNGTSYIMYSKVACFIYDEAASKLIQVELDGIEVATVIGLVASSGYLILYTDLAIAWSSTIDPLDFVPSQVTGAGGGNVAGLAGKIEFCTYNSLGILIYTEANIIAGTYTGNAQYPFKFREVEGSQGGISLDLVAYEANSASQFVYSKAGIQAITSQRSETILPEITDFLAGRRFEDYNEITEKYELTNIPLNQAMIKKIKFVASRYLIISYGLPGSNFTHALVFDSILRRMGKLKLVHTDVFELIGTQPEVSKESIAFLLSDGSVKTLDFSTKSEGSGVVILGKLQFSRSRLLSLLTVDIENVAEESPIKVSSQLSLDGKNFSVVQGVPSLVDPNVRVFNFRATGINHSLVIYGVFNLVTVLVTFTLNGRR
jgi:hypothetical protein